MKLQEQLTHTLDHTPASLQALSELIDPLWIAQALQATGSASIRRRKLPAEQVIWLVIGLALFRNHSIASVVRQLNLSLGEGPCVPSAAVQGRQRLGEVALEHLFRQLASAWGAHSHRSLTHLMRCMACTGCASWPLTVWFGRPRTPRSIGTSWGVAAITTVRAVGLRSGRCA